MADGRLIFDTKLDTSGLKKGLEQLPGIAKAGAASIAVIGAAVMAVGVAATTAGIEFESAFAGVKKTVNGTEAELEGLRNSLRALSKEIPVAASDLAGLAASAGQLGIKNENIIAFTRTIANLGVATNLAGEAAATTLAKFANITQMPQEDFERLGSAIVALGNNFATTEQDIAAMGMRLAGAGSQIGMSEAQILSFSTALSSVGIEAEAGGSAFSRLMSDIQLATETGGTDLNNFANVAGMSAQEFKKAFKEDAAGALVSFIQGLGAAEQRGSSVTKVLDDLGITELRLTDALKRAAGASDVFANAIETGNQAWEDNTALAKEAATRYETVESQLQLLANGLTDVGISMYDNFQDPIKEAIKSVVSDVTSLNENISSAALSNSLNEIAQAVANLIKYVGEAVSFWLPKMIDLLALIAKHGNIIISVISGITSAMTAFKIASEISKIITAWQKAAAVIAMYSSAQAIANGVNAIAAINAAALNGALSTQTTIVALLTGKLKLQTIAQMALNAARAADPSMWVGLAVGVLTAAIVGCTLAMQNAESASTELNDKIEEINQTYHNAIDAAEQKLKTDEAEIKKSEVLRDELMKLTDEQGNVVHEKERARTIINQLIDIYPSLTDAIRDENGELNVQSDLLNTLINKQYAYAKAKAYASKAEAEATRIINLEEQKSAATSLKQGSEYNANYYDGERIKNANKQSLYGAYLAAEFMGLKEDEVEKISEADKTIRQLESDIAGAEYNLKYYTGQSIVNTPADTPGDKPKRTYGDLDLTPSGSSSNSADREAAAALREAEEYRKKLVENYTDNVDEMSRLDDRWVRHQKDKGLLSLNDEQYNLQEKAKLYRGYADEVLYLAYMTEEEKYKYRKEYLEKAEDLELAAWKIQQQREKTEAKERTDNSFAYVDESSYFNEWANGDDPMKARQRVSDALQQDIAAGLKTQAEADAKLAEFDRILYENRLANSEQWISDMKAFGELSYDEEVAAYQRIREYTQEYYDKGLIDRKTYFEEMNRLDRKFYALEREEMERQIKDRYKLLHAALDEEERITRKKYEDGNALEKSNDREKDLAELKELEALYANAVTVEGQNKLKDIRRQIEAIEKEKKQEQRELEYKEELADIEEARTNLVEQEKKAIESMVAELSKNGKYMKEISEDVTDVMKRASAIYDSVLSGVTLAHDALHSMVQNSYSVIQNNNNTINDPTAADAVRTIPMPNIF